MDKQINKVTLNEAKPPASNSKFASSEALLQPQTSDNVSASNLKPETSNEAKPPAPNSKVASSEALLKPPTSDNVSASNLQPPTSNSEKLKPLASISLDLDNLWSYMKTHGDPGWESFPSYLDIFIPMALDALDDLNLNITFFIVGQDAALEKNHDVLKMLTERGHEVGNHSFNHEPWLHLYPKDQIKGEILETGGHILRVTGQKPIGFRGPGFSWSPELLEVLIENDYLYDASTLPTYLGPLARAYYFWKSDLTEDEKEKRKKLYGSFSEGFRPVKPYFLQISDENKILEIPVTTMPVFKTPFHLSYLIYLSRFSQILMIFYLNLAIQMCRMTGTKPSFLLHPLDLIGGDLVRELAFFPGMDVSTSKKMEIFNRVLSYLQKYYDLISLNTFAESTIQQNSAKEVQILSKPVIS